MAHSDPYLKMVSLLMQYPDEAYFRDLSEIKTLVGTMPTGARQAAIDTFITNLEAGDALQAQAQYTALFDLSPETTLNVTYHLWGDGEKRARLLTRLQETYLREGWERISSELPEILP